MGERKVAPHVARAIGAAQAKPNPEKTRPEPARPASAQLAAALRPPAQAAQPSRPPQRPPAAHVAASVARAAAPPAALQKKPCSPVPAARAPHVAAAIAAPPPLPPAPPGGRLARLAGHVAAAQARMAPPVRPAAPHVARATGAAAPAGVLQAAKKGGGRSLENDKKKLFGAIDEVNLSIVKLDPKQPQFFVGTIRNLQDQKVAIKNLPKRTLKLTHEQTRMSNFAYSIKHRFKVAPEVQIGELESGGSRFFRFSANKQSFNKKIGEGVTRKTTVRSFYRRFLRGHHVEQRQEGIKRFARTLKVRELKRILAEAYDFESSDKFTFYDAVRHGIAAEAHRANRREEYRLRAKSSRELAIRNKRHYKVSVTRNSDDIHAESSIYKEKGSKETLISVIGTKVPCLACLTFFNDMDVPDAVLNHTSFGWFSKSSLKQLGFTPEKVKEYLEHLYQTLGQVPNVFQYGQSDGEIAIRDMTFDDSDTDSEDEEAIFSYDFQVTSTKKDESLKKRIEDFATQNFKVKKKTSAKKKKPKRKN